MSIPGIGPIISSAMVAAIGTGDSFSKGRDFAAWLGLVPRQISTGDRTILGKISKRGNRYLRVLFVQAAWVVLVKVKPTRWEGHGLRPWIEAAKKRLHHNVLAIALANKLARIAWSMSMVEPSRRTSVRLLRDRSRVIELPAAEVCERMRRDGGSVFPAHANTGDPNGPVEACPLMRSHAR